MKHLVRFGSLVVATLVAGCAGEELDEQGGASDGGETFTAAPARARFIVAFQPGRAAAGRAALAGAGGSVELELAPQNAVAVSLPAAAVAGLSNNPNIEYIEEDAVRKPLALWNNVTSAGETLPYGVQMVQADKVVASAPSKRKVCIIDSGYGQSHDDLRDEASEITGNDNTGTGHWDWDSCGHGTHVAGTIAAISGNGAGVVGAAPGTSLHIVKVFGNDNLASGACEWAYSSTLVAAVNECRANGAHVISMSLGGPNRSATEERAFTNAWNGGVLSIAAAGNDGNTRTSYPAGYGTVVSVAAIDANEALADFSQRNKDVEIAAPGVAVLSTVPWLESNTLSAGGTTWSGGYVDGGARTSGISGDLVNGGLCDAVGAWTGKVVLCQRGTIAFAQKVANVKAGGGVAAVIYNNVASDPTCGLFGASGDPTTIPAISLSCADGASALGAIGTAGTVASSVTVSASGYEAWDGTSMATPHVSAVAALIWSCNTAKTNAQIRTALQSSAKNLGPAGRDSSFGFGLVQAKAALLALGVGNCTVLP